LIQIVGLLDEAASRRNASRRTGHPGCVQHSASVLIQLITAPLLDRNHLVSPCVILNFIGLILSV
jgi:hypothetical protein